MKLKSSILRIKVIIKRNIYFKLYKLYKLSTLINNNNIEND